MGEDEDEDEFVSDDSDRIAHAVGRAAARATKLREYSL
jgi:hypothetical protein